MALYRTVLPYSVFALRSVAATVTNEPQQYARLMLQAAALNPACYYDLGNHALRQTNEDQAAQYFDKAAWRSLTRTRGQSVILKSAPSVSGS